MKKFLLIVFILLDAAVISASAIFLTAHLKGTSTMMGVTIPAMPMTSSPAPSGSAGMAPSAAVSVMSTSTTQSPTPAPMAMGAPGAANPALSHRIGFTYRNPHAKRVMIRADFTGWRAEPMEKNAATGVWKYTAVLEPGEYAYCYSVDDKSIRDPANKHTKTVGKTVVSSIVVPSSNIPAH